MKLSEKKIAGIAVSVIFFVFVVFSFGIFPDVGERILYGKHPPEKKPEFLNYSEIILSGNYECMESSSLKAKGDLPRFIEEFNKCNI